jgi:Fe-S-cluster containining protein
MQLEINKFDRIYENKLICTSCGGKCCKSMGCHYAPSDFTEITFETLNNLLAEGYTSIDWWEGDVFGGDRECTYFLRVRNVNANIVDPSWGGRCILLTDKGCKLSYQDRPKGGRSLIPNSSGDCIVTYSKEECCQEWYDYQDILDRLVEKYR